MFPSSKLFNIHVVFDKGLKISQKKGHSGKDMKCFSSNMCINLLNEDITIK